MINKSIINKGKTFEKNLGKQKWIKLKELLLQTKLDIEQISDNEWFIKIPDEKYADIEIFPTYSVSTPDQSFVHIQLWFYEFKSEMYQGQIKGYEHRRLNNVVEAMNYINRILMMIREDKKLEKYKGN